MPAPLPNPLRSLGEPRKRVLIIEDDPQIADLIATRLELAGLRTSIARNGRDGLTRAADLKPDAIVLDINMPIMDGFGVLTEMRASPLLRAIPTLVLTARNKPEDVAHAIGLGAKDFLTKPFNDKDLIRRVARLLGPRRPAAPVRSEAPVDVDLDC